MRITRIYIHEHIHVYEYIYVDEVINEDTPVCLSPLSHHTRKLNLLLRFYMDNVHTGYPR